MNQQDENGAWDGVTERREGERRERGPAQHVEIDGISNGARMLIERAIHTGENAVDEAKRTRRWVVGALTLIGAFLFAAGEFRGKTNDALQVRPTEMAVRAMFDSSAVLREARDSAVVARLHEQQIILEVMGERQRATIEGLSATQDDVEAIKRRLQMP